MIHKTKSKKKVHPQIAEAIRTLHGLLLNEYTDDFAYTIMAKGHVIAASNLRMGIVEPREDK